MSSILIASNISKSYGAVEALAQAHLAIEQGEVHALCGDNGAGKSTLIKILAGVERPDGGQIQLKGQTVRFTNPQSALDSGIATIHQDLGLAVGMGIYQNIFMGSELERHVFGLRFLDKRRMMAQSLGFLQQIHSPLRDMRMPVQNLSGGQRQSVAIARALRWAADIIIMDEPTAALGVRETAQVLQLILRLKHNGITVILVSHNMADIVSVADRITILKSGRTRLTCPIGTMSAQELTQLIIRDDP